MLITLNDNNINTHHKLQILTEVLTEYRQVVHFDVLLQNSFAEWKSLNAPILKDFALNLFNRKHEKITLLTKKVPIFFKEPQFGK